MKNFSNIKHTILLIIIISIISLLAFTIEGSENYNITNIKISGNNYLSVNRYLKYAELDFVQNKTNLSLALIQDRLEKHPYIKDVDVELLERGTIQVYIHEKKMDAILLSNSQQYLITEKAEIIPFFSSTKAIDLPVIVYQKNAKKINLFGNACVLSELYCALKIISTAEQYDKLLYKNLSEINLNNKNNISISLSEFPSPIYFGTDNEIEKTVYLSKIFRHLKGNDLINYLNYVDLRYNELVYLGFDDKILSDKETI